MPFGLEVVQERRLLQFKKVDRRLDSIEEHERPLAGKRSEVKTELSL